MFVEQSSVSVQGRITYGCLGIWNDAQTEGHARTAALIHQFNAKAAIQIAHSGRKGSSQRPWEGGWPLGQADIDARGEGPWEIAAASSIPFDDGSPAPHMLTSEEIEGVWKTSVAHSSARRRPATTSSNCTARTAI